MLNLRISLFHVFSLREVKYVKARWTKSAEVQQALLLPKARNSSQMQSLKNNTIVQWVGLVTCATEWQYTIRASKSAWDFFFFDVQSCFSKRYSVAKSLISLSHSQKVRTASYPKIKTRCTRRVFVQYSYKEKKKKTTCALKLSAA